MSKIKNGGLDQYDAAPFKQQLKWCIPYAQPVLMLNLIKA